MKQAPDSPTEVQAPNPPASRGSSLLTLNLEIPGDLEAMLRGMVRTWEHGEITKTHLAIEALGCLGRGTRENFRELKEGK